MSDPRAVRPDDEALVINEERTDLKPPSKYLVVFLNDDFTPMDFVTDVLIKHFGHNETTATQIMLQVEENGEGVAGIYPLDIAETKRMIVVEEARAEGHPLMLRLTAEDD